MSNIKDNSKHLITLVLTFRSQIQGLSCLLNVDSTKNTQSVGLSASKTNAAELDANTKAAGALSSRPAKIDMQEKMSSNRNEKSRHVATELVSRQLSLLLMAGHLMTCSRPMVPSCKLG